MPLDLPVTAGAGMRTTGEEQLASPKLPLESLRGFLGSGATHEYTFYRTGSWKGVKMSAPELGSTAAVDPMQVTWP